MLLTKACGPFLIEHLVNATGMKSFFSYLNNVRAEMAHVVWPDRKQAAWHTVLIIVISAVLALLISGLDLIFTRVVERLVG